MKNKSVSKTLLKKAVTQSSKMEGKSFAKAKKNTALVKKLKQYGRAFAV
jgi:hypothetical protein